MKILFSSLYSADFGKRNEDVLLAQYIAQAQELNLDIHFVLASAHEDTRVKLAAAFAGTNLEVDLLTVDVPKKKYDNPAYHEISLGKKLLARVIRDIEASYYLYIDSDVEIKLSDVVRYINKLTSTVEFVNFPYVTRKHKDIAAVEQFGAFVHTEALLRLIDYSEEVYHLKEKNGMIYRHNAPDCAIRRCLLANGATEVRATDVESKHYYSREVYGHYFQEECNMVGELNHFYSKIHGWFNFEELYKTRVARASSVEPSIFVEVGSWMGKSASFMGVEIKNSKKPITFYCVDTWKGSAEHQATMAKYNGSIKHLFLENTKPVEDVIIPIESTSVEAASQFEDGSLDFVYIDAAHDFLSVRNDIMAWKPKLKSTGMLAGHDITWPSVLAAVQDQLPWKQIYISDGNSWSFPMTKRLAGRWIHKTVPISKLPEHMICVACVTNPARLNKAITSLFRPDLRILVVDSSENGLNLEQYPWFKNVSVFKTAGQPHFTQIQNFFQAAARDEGINNLVFMHSDIVCKDLEFVPDVIRYSDAQFNSDPSIAGVFTWYDALCVFNLKALEKVGVWDETFAWYHSDVDYYDRVKLWGFRFDILDPQGRLHHDTSRSTHDDPKIAAMVAEQSDWAGKHMKHKWNNFQNNKVPYGY